MLIPLEPHAYQSVVRPNNLGYYALALSLGSVRSYRSGFPWSVQAISVLKIGRTGPLPARIPNDTYRGGRQLEL